MVIADVSGYALSSPIKRHQDRQFHGSYRHLLKRNVVLVVVETADGTRGVATAGVSNSVMTEYFEGDSQGTFADVVDDAVSNALTGEMIETVTDAHDLLREGDVPEGDLIEAISTIDVALYDIRDKQQGVPVYKLLAEQYGTTPSRRRERGDGRDTGRAR